MRKFSAREAPLRLQAGAVRRGLRGDPTIFVVDLAPATAISGALDLQELRKQVSDDTACDVMACCCFTVAGKHLGD